MRRFSLGVVALGLAATLLFASASAAGVNSPQASRHSKSLATVKLAVPGLTISAAAYLGRDKGIFAKYSINLVIIPVTGPAALAAALSGGSADVATNTVVTMLNARAQGLPFQIVAPQIAGTPKLNGLMVNKGSSIKRPRDLVGKTIGVSALNGIDDLLVRQWVQNDGGDGSKVKFVLTPSTAMQSSVESGQIDGATPSQPFFGLMVANGDKYLGYYFAPAGANAALANFVATESWVKSNPTVALHFSQAMAKASAYANAHPAEVRAALPNYIAITPDAAKTVPLPVFATTIHRSLLKKLAAMMLKWGYISQPLDVTNAVWSRTVGLKP